jgi:hypothetical protein
MRLHNNLLHCDSMLLSSYARARVGLRFGLMMTRSLAARDKLCHIVTLVVTLCDHNCHLAAHHTSAGCPLACYRVGIQIASPRQDDANFTATTENETMTTNEQAAANCRARFIITHEIVTPESAEYGDAEERGELDSDLSLRDALRIVTATRTRHVGGIECIHAEFHRGAHVTVDNSMEFLTGACESRTLHIPYTVTKASQRRIARLVGARI